MYQSIPLRLSAITGNEEPIAQILLSAAKVQLIKRTRTSINGGRMSSKDETVVGVASVGSTNESQAGVHTVLCELRPSGACMQRSWSVEGVAEQQVSLMTSQ